MSIETLRFTTLPVHKGHVGVGGLLHCNPFIDEGGGGRVLLFSNVRRGRLTRETLENYGLAGEVSYMRGVGPMQVQVPIFRVMLSMFSIT